MHTYGTNVESDVSFQKSTWDMEKREQNLENAYCFCEAAGIDARGNLAVIGYNKDDNTCRVINGPDEDILTKKNGNVLITSGKTVLMGWAADCCLVGFVVNGGEYVAVAHASVKTLKNGVIDTAMMKIMELAGTDCYVEAFVGTCIGKCCYEYDKEEAYDDFKDYWRYIWPTDNPKKVTLDLYAAVVSALIDAGVDEIVDIFEEDERCTACTKDIEGNYMFSSYRREKDPEDPKKHINGQYGLFIAIK